MSYNNHLLSQKARQNEDEQRALKATLEELNAIVRQRVECGVLEDSHTDGREAPPGMLTLSADPTMS